MNHLWEGTEWAWDAQEVNKCSLEDWLQLVLSNRYVSACLWQNHPATESKSEKWDSEQTNKTNKDPYRYLCESSLGTLAQHLPVLISASPTFFEPPTSQKLKPVVFTNKNMIKNCSEASKAPILACCSTDVFFIIAEFWSLSARYRLKLDRISTHKKKKEYKK